MDLQRLEAMGAISSYETELGDVAHAVRPAGVRNLLRLSVGRAVVASTHPRACAASELSKVEILFELFENGYRPVAHADPLTPSGEQLVAMGSLTRSKK